MLSFSFPLKLHANYLGKRKGWNEMIFTFWITCTVEFNHFHNFNCCFTVNFDKYKIILPTNAIFIKR
jgi:hypothetical protein